MGEHPYVKGEKGAVEGRDINILTFNVSSVIQAGRPATKTVVLEGSSFGRFSGWVICVMGTKGDGVKGAIADIASGHPL